MILRPCRRSGLGVESRLEKTALMGKKRKGGKATVLVAIDVSFSDDQQDVAPTGLRYSLFGDASKSEVRYSWLFSCAGDGAPFS